MRSRLLLSVAHLPTIRETSEEILPGGAGQEPPASPSLDDYVRSICQLAQPTSVLDKVTVRGRPNRAHRPAQTTEKRSGASSLRNSNPCSSGQQPTLPSAGIDDPLAWLFGASQEQQLNGRDVAMRSGPSGGHCGAHRQTDSGKARERLCEARMPDCSLARPSQDKRPTSNPKSWTSARTCRASACGPRPSSILRSLYLHLPVIHEL
uniref:protein DEPP1 n=1 Tax=Jaculus jaculus TaxID=51337 RepID=UPI001E1AFD9E|nr:protein DEPP1 [Jaculus jaculus]